jgi:hypothetical protein
MNNPACKLQLRRVKGGIAMRKCVLNVTEHEYDKILQLNHDAVVWKNADRELLHGLNQLVGEETVNQLRKFEECRMEKHNDMVGLPRLQAL